MRAYQNKHYTEFNIPGMKKFKSIQATSDDLKLKISQFEREDRVLKMCRHDLREKINVHIAQYDKLIKEETKK